MRTADICPNCMEVIKNSGINMLSLGQLMDAMEGIRRYFLAVMRTDFLSRPSRILIESYTHRIFFPDYGNLELNLNPKQRTIYCFFLRHLEGVRFVDLIDHSSELGHLYRRFSNQGSPEEIEVSLNLLINPMENNLNEVLSKIKKRLNETLGQRIAEKYYIKGIKGAAYKIELDSELIDYQSEL